MMSGWPVLKLVVEALLQILICRLLNLFLIPFHVKDLRSWPSRNSPGPSVSGPLHAHIQFFIQNTTMTGQLHKMAFKNIPSAINILNFG